MSYSNTQLTCSPRQAIARSEGSSPPTRRSRDRSQPMPSDTWVTQALYFSVVLFKLSLCVVSFFLSFEYENVMVLMIKIVMIQWRTQETPLHICNKRRQSTCVCVRVFRYVYICLFLSMYLSICPSIYTSIYL